MKDDKMKKLLTLTAAALVSLLPALQAQDAEEAPNPDAPAKAAPAAGPKAKADKKAATDKEAVPASRFADQQKKIEKIQEKTAGCPVFVTFDIDFLEWVISFGSLALIIIVELLNTAIEATVDMVTKEYNEYAKIAKDCGSAATGIMSILAAIVNLIIFMPYILELIINWF